MAALMSLIQNRTKALNTEERQWIEIFMHICKCEMLYLTELLDAILFIRYVHIHSFIKMLTTRLTVTWINLNVSIIKQ